MEIARKGLETAKRLAPRLSPEWGSRILRLWGNAVIAADALLCLIENTVDYFEFMEQLRTPEEYAEAVRKRTPLLKTPEKAEGFFNGIAHNVFPLKPVPVEKVYIEGISGINGSLVAEYAAEYKLRQAWSSRTDVADFILPGTVCDDWKCERNMHAAYGDTENGLPGRYVGNQVFPNGYIEFDLAGEGCSIELQGAGKINVEIDGVVKTACMTAGQGCVVEFSAAGKELRRCRLTKSGKEYPWILGVGVLK